MELQRWSESKIRVFIDISFYFILLLDGGKQVSRTRTDVSVGQGISVKNWFQNLLKLLAFTTTAFCTNLLYKRPWPKFSLPGKKTRNTASAFQLWLILSSSWPCCNAKENEFPQAFSRRSQPEGQKGERPYLTRFWPVLRYFDVGDYDTRVQEW